MGHLELNFFIIINLIIKIQSFITYDTNTLAIDSFIQQDMECMNGKIYTQTETFSDEFENIPQIFFTRQYFDQSFATVEMSFQVTSVSKIDFSIQLICVQRQVYKMILTWIAYDDSRVEILNFFDSTKSGQLIEPHNNHIALKGFPSIISLSYDGAFSVDINIDEITPTEVKYTITKTGGLINVGYQILLILEDSFSFINRLFETATYTSNILSLMNNYRLMISYVGFNFENTDWIREYILYTNTDTTIQYQLQNNYQKTPNTHFAAWIAYLFTTQFLPLEITRINTAQYNERDLCRPFNQVKILELNKQFSFYGSHIVVIESQFNIVNLEIINVCKKGRKYVSIFNTCSNCSGSKSIKQFNKICILGQNTLAYRFRLIDSQMSIKEINIELSKTGVKVKQILHNQKLSEVILVEIFEQQNQ